MANVHVTCCGDKTFMFPSGMQFCRKCKKVFNPDGSYNVKMDTSADVVRKAMKK